MINALSPIFKILKNRWAQLFLGILLASGAGYWAGYSTRPEPKKIVDEKIIEKEVIDMEAIDRAVAQAKQEWRKLQKTRVVSKITTKPSGETIEETVTETETLESQERNRRSEKESELSQVTEKSTKRKTKIQILPVSSQWSLGVRVHKELDILIDSPLGEKLDYETNVGRKIFKNTWLELSYRIKSQEVGVGISYDF